MNIRTDVVTCFEKYMLISPYLCELADNCRIRYPDIRQPTAVKPSCRLRAFLMIHLCDKMPNAENPRFVDVLVVVDVNFFLSGACESVSTLLLVGNAVWLQDF